MDDIGGAGSHVRWGGILGGKFGIEPAPRVWRLRDGGGAMTERSRDFLSAMEARGATRTNPTPTTRRLLHTYYQVASK